MTAPGSMQQDGRNLADLTAETRRIALDFLQGLQDRPVGAKHGHCQVHTSAPPLSPRLWPPASMIVPRAGVRGRMALAVGRRGPDAGGVWARLQA